MQVLGQPCPDVGMFVGSVVVGDDVADLTFEGGALDCAEEFAGFVMGAPGHAAPEDDAVENVAGSEPGGVPCHANMGHGSPAPLASAAGWLCAIECLDLPLRVDRPDDGVGGIIHVEINNVFHLCGEDRSIGFPESSQAVRLPAMSLPDSRHRAHARRQPSERGLQS